MNKKSKLLLTSVGLAVLSGIAATGSTFAWFTATRTASLSYSKATVETTTSNLKISYLGNAGTFSDPSGGITNVTELDLLGGAAITDISGDGLEFVKPVWSATSTIASDINSVDTAVGNYLEVSISVINEGSSVLNVYLGEGTGISAHDQEAASQKALKAARLAVITGEEGTTLADQVQFIIVADENDTVHEYLSAESVDATFPLNFGNGDVDTYIETYENVIHQDDIETKHLISDANAIGAKLGVIEGNSDLKVTFRLWIEGQDPDAVNDAIGGVLDFAADIYALEA